MGWARVFLDKRATKIGIGASDTGDQSRVRPGQGMHRLSCPVLFAMAVPCSPDPLILLGRCRARGPAAPERVVVQLSLMVSPPRLPDRVRLGPRPLELGRRVSSRGVRRSHKTRLTEDFGTHPSSDCQPLGSSKRSFPTTADTGADDGFALCALGKASQDGQGMASPRLCAVSEARSRRVNQLSQHLLGHGCRSSTYPSVCVPIASQAARSRLVGPGARPVVTDEQGARLGPGDGDWHGDWVAQMGPDVSQIWQSGTYTRYLGSLAVWQNRPCPQRRNSVATYLPRWGILERPGGRQTSYCRCDHFGSCSLPP